MISGWEVKHWEAQVGANADLPHKHISAASPTFAGDAHSAAAEEVTVIINNPVSLVCEALEYPSPNITWLKDEVPLKASRNILLLPGTVLAFTDCMTTVPPCCMPVGLGAGLLGLAVVQGNGMVRSSSCRTHQVDAGFPCAASSENR